MKTATRTRKTYDPGQPGEICKIGKGQYAVQSFRDEDSFYAVGLQAGTCTCPHAQLRDPEGGCKHFRLAKAEALREAKEAARKMSAADLHNLLKKYQDRPEVAEAIQSVIYEKLETLCNQVSEQVKNREYCPV